MIRCSACNRRLVGSDGKPYFLECDMQPHHKICSDCVDGHDKMCSGKLTLKVLEGIGKSK